MRILVSFVGLASLAIGGFFVLLVLAFASTLDPGPAPGEPPRPTDPAVYWKIAQQMPLPLLFIVWGAFCIWIASRPHPDGREGTPL